MRALPQDPGVYLMKDGRGGIIYVGKAKSLKSRVGSYFINKHDNVKTAALVAEVSDFDVILVKTEVEALLLERTLIKHHQPRFNILLRDDKEYPFIRVDFRAEWPRLEKVRKRKDDGATYVGPFGNPGFLRTLLEATYRIFPLIRCSAHEFANAKRPCNYYHMKMCLGPCTLPVDRAVYIAMIQDALAFLRGQNKDLAKQLKQRMQDASANELFELAGSYRDQLLAFEAVSAKQTVVGIDADEADVIGFVTDETHAALNVVMVRDHKILGADSFLARLGALDKLETLEQLLLQYYDQHPLPREILLPHLDEAALSLFIQNLCQAQNLSPAGTTPPTAQTPQQQPVPSIRTTFPQRGPKRELLELAEKNAAHSLSENSLSAERERVMLTVLQERLGLPTLPHRMECIDISNIQGTAIVASNVCFIGGKPAKEFYRHYKIADFRPEGPDDFGSIREVVERRFERARRDHDAPDLLIIDGGKGQLSAALDAAHKFPDLIFPIVSLAKSRLQEWGPQNPRFDGRSLDTNAPERSFERVFIQDKNGAIADTAIPLAPGTAEYRLLTQIRDEAHRFAITHHRKRRSKLLQGSILEEISGVGKTLRQRLLVEFGGIEGLKQASLEQLQKVKGLRGDAAVALYSKLRE